MKIIFMGTPEFSVAALDGLIGAGHEIVAVYCQPPRRAGRGKKSSPVPVQMRAERLGLEVRHPLSLKTAEAQEEFKSFDADIAVVVAYGLILPDEVLNAPKHGCLNIHASLLPRWRGAAPIHRAIMAGDKETGICIMQMDSGLDTGAVLLRRSVAIGELETTSELHDRLSEMGGELIVEAVSQLEQLSPEPQSGDGITYAHKIDKSEAQVDWSMPAIKVDRLIRGLSRFPGAWCEINGERIKLLRSRVVDRVSEPGHLLGGFTVACGEGAVEILTAQRQGKRPMETAELLKGLTLPDRL